MAKNWAETAVTSLPVYYALLSSQDWEEPWKYRAKIWTENKPVALKSELTYLAGVSEIYDNTGTIHNNTLVNKGETN